MEKSMKYMAAADVAVLFNTFAMFFSYLPAAHGFDSTAFFGYVGSFRAVSSNASYATVAPLQSCNQLCCCSLCAADDQCVGANYRYDTSQCIMLRLAKWQMESDGGYMLLVKGTAMSNLENRQYRTVFGALSDSVLIDGRKNYTVSMVQNASQCQSFCEMQFDYCYAYQFHSLQLICKVFVGNYTGDYLPFDSTDTSWSISYHFRSAEGPYRILPGAYPKSTGLSSYNVVNIMDPLRCRQLCENQSTNCSLFAYHVGQSLCYIFPVDVPPNLLSFDFTAVNWTAYYRFRNGSDPRECSTSYYFVSKSLGRDAAEQYCISTYGALLAKIDSSDESTFVSTVLKSTPGLANNNIWIGAKSATYPYDFRWSCGGTNISFSAWRTGEPNNQNEFCTHMWADFSWNNAGCTSPSYFFICEQCRTAGCS